MLNSEIAERGGPCRAGASILPKMRAKSRNDGGEFSLRPHPPLDFHRTLERYRVWGPDPANVYQDGTFYRVARVGGHLVPFRLTASGSVGRPSVAVRFAGPDGPEVRRAVRQQVTQLLGLGWDLSGFYGRVRRDPVLAPLVRRLYGLRPTVAPDPFEMLVGAIAAQQVNLAFAFRVRGRLVERFGESTRLDGIVIRAFPTPAAVSAADVPALRAMQFSARKAEFVIGLARLVADGELDLAALATIPDDAVITRLTRVRGLGRWTAEWFLSRGLGRPDVCPAEDLGVRRAFETFCFRGRPTDAARIRRRAQAWRPFRSLAVHYLLAASRLPPESAGADRIAAVPQD